jgi:hypothetical protein
MQSFKYVETDVPARKWPAIATCYMIGGAFMGLLFAALFIRAPYWLTGSLAIAFSYSGGALGGYLYKRFHCTVS